MLDQLDTFMGQLAGTKTEIVRAIDSIDRLSVRLAAQKKDIAQAIEAMPGGPRSAGSATTGQMLKALQLSRAWPPT